MFILFRCLKEQASCKIVKIVNFQLTWAVREGFQKLYLFFFLRTPRWSLYLIMQKLEKISSSYSEYWIVGKHEVVWLHIEYLCNCKAMSLHKMGVNWKIQVAEVSKWFLKQLLNWKINQLCCDTFEAKMTKCSIIWIK